MNILNPWVLLGIGVAMISIAAAAHMHGVKQGQLQQLAVQNELINKVNNKLAANKAEAAKLIKERQDEIDTLIAKRDALIFRLETERQANVKVTNDLRTKYAGLQLRFKSATTTRGGIGGTDEMHVGQAATGNAETASCVISDETTTALREIAYDCDTLRDDYKLLYDFVNPEAEVTDANNP